MTRSCRCRHPEVQREDVHDVQPHGIAHRAAAGACAVAVEEGVGHNDAGCAEGGQCAACAEMALPYVVERQHQHASAEAEHAEPAARGERNARAEQEKRGEQRGSAAHQRVRVGHIHIAVRDGQAQVEILA